jgi:2-polyprenyl-3-methyl-5-hydroxy-6-metoxy-1,4-benzoquinol methylase
MGRDEASPMNPDVTAATDAHAREVSAGKRFEFGKNWLGFADHVDDGRIAHAEASLRRMLAVDDLRGRSFLDIGCGSGLFSLAAARLGARVTSFDYDPSSVACTRRLKARYLAGREDWSIEEGSVLDPGYLEQLGMFDVVYSWGVLHHTGAMWPAVANAAERVRQGGSLFIALYNDQGLVSSYWKVVKRLYNAHPALKLASILVHFPHPFATSMAARLVTGRLKAAERRGMTYWYDYLDWLGGHPFEVAKPKEVEDFLRPRGFSLVRQNLTRRSGCSEFVFSRAP